MHHSLEWPVFGVLAAIAITTAMDTSRLSAFSALPLAALFDLFWILQRFSRVVVCCGLAFGAWHLSAVLLETGFNPPLVQVPFFVINAILLAAIW